MPALYAFGRRWSIGSDDFVAPCIIDILIRLGWLIASFVIFVKNEAHFQECEGGLYIKIYFYWIFGILQLICLTNIGLIRISMRGTIMDVELRKNVAPTLYFRTFLQVIEIIQNLVASYWTLNNYFSCSNANEALKLINGLIICNWVLLFLRLWSYYLIFDPLGKKELILDRIEHDPSVDKKWENRCEILCCPCLRSRDNSAKAAFQEIARMFGTCFEDDDLVMSDVVAGLVLLSLKKERKRSCHLESIKCDRIIESPICNQSIKKVIIEKSNLKKCLIRREIDSASLAEETWPSMRLLHYYLRFSFACFTFPYILKFERNLIRPVWKRSVCCGCIPGRSYPVEVEGDNCLFCHTTSIREILGMEDDEDVIYATYKNKVCTTPFYVCLDHNTKSIVIAVRGSFSVDDLITDLTGWPTGFGPGFPEEFKAHHAMLVSAQNVKERLDSLNILKKLKVQYPNYHVVTTGTSLGAGTSVLLAILLKPEHPDLKCYAYAPPAGLLSEQAAKYTESFVFSVIYGDDMVCRLSIKSFERLKYKVMKAITACKTPKYRILLGCCQALAGISPKLNFEEDEDKETESENSPQIISKRESQIILLSTSDKEYSENSSNNSLNNNSVNQMKFGELKYKVPVVATYVPGILLYIRESDYFLEGRNNPQSEPRWDIRWANRPEFNKMILSQRMLADHVPLRLNKALEYFAYTNPEPFEKIKSNYQLTLS